MVKFLDNETEHKLRMFISHDLGYKYNQPIQVKDDVIVTGTTGSDKIVECLKVRFYPAHSQVEWVEDKIAGDIHRYCFENQIDIVKDCCIVRDVWNGEIRYSLIYTNGGF